MPKQLHICQNSDEPTVIDVQEDESIHVQLDTHPRSREGVLREPTFGISGLRWRDGRHFHLGWLQQPISLGTSLRVDYVIDDKPTSALSKDVEYIAPDPTCSFCDRKASEIDLLIKRSHIHYICDSCVDECKGMVDEWRTTRDA